MEVIVKPFFDQIAPIIRIYDLQCWYPIPRETLSLGEGAKYWGNGKICGFRLKLPRVAVAA